MMLRVARIPYLNSAPFYGGFPAPGIDLLDLPPRQLGDAVRSGVVDAGIVSLCDTFELPGFEPLGDLGIAVPGPAHSVLLFSRLEPSELGGRVIGITTETATSIELLKLLLHERFGVSEALRLERREASEPGDDALLLIGDRALAEAGRSRIWPGRSSYGPGPVRLPEGGTWSWMLDLAGEWRAWQGLPFVFARWTVREDVDASARAVLEAALERSLRDSQADLARAARRYPGACSLDEEAAVAYLSGFRYRFAAEDRQAIDAFRGMIGARARIAPASATSVRGQA